jgi:antitoxin component YwqK of YwqJK toxin-antitoxin module
MKKIILPLLLSAVTSAFAQKNNPTTPSKAPEPAKAVSPILRGEQLTGTIDTLRSPDPLTPGRSQWTILNPNGSVKAQGFMRDGKRDGVWREYASSNNVLMKIEEYKDGRKNGAAVSFSAIGQVSLNETYLNDTLQGPRLTYSNNGRIKTMEQYVNGILEGNRRSFYDDSKLQEDANYKHGLRNGVSKWYSSSGKPSIEYTYVNGELSGPAKLFDENGDLKQEGSFQAGDEEGEWKVYENKVLVKKVYYRKGEVTREVPVKK